MSLHGTPVLVACPDARPPAYQAVVGLAHAGLLGGFLTGYFNRGPSPFDGVLRRLSPAWFERWDRLRQRRSEPGIPGARVRSAWSYDLALRLEGRLADRSNHARRELASWRTRRFDRTLTRTLRRDRPAAALVFSDVGSGFALPFCKREGIPYVLSMVHGDVREERAVLEREEQAAPEFFSLYLGQGSLDREELGWLHDRRLRELELADRVLVPSDHIAATIVGYGVNAARVDVIPYAADTRRFRPDPSKRHGEGCTFLFAGGISQRKGVGYLLRAWQRVRRPGWRLQLLGALPRDPGPLEPLLDGVALLGRVAHAEVPARMAAADVFVFPSLFEGSAVVTYEALACGLPGIVTPAAGSVLRDGVEGFVVPPADVESLAAAMERLGADPELRAGQSGAARRRAEAYDWPRYHAAIAAAVREALCA